MYLYEDKIILTFNYKDGSKTITLAEVEGSDLSVLGAVNRNKKPPEIQGFPVVFLYFTNLLIFLRNFINISVF